MNLKNDKKKLWIIKRKSCKKREHAEEKKEHVEEWRKHAVE